MYDMLDFIILKLHLFYEFYTGSCQFASVVCLILNNIFIIDIFDVTFQLVLRPNIKPLALYDGVQ